MSVLRENNGMVVLQDEEVDREDFLKKEIILKYLTRKKKLLNVVADEVNQAKLFQDHPQLNFVWESVYAYYKNYKKEPGKDFLFLDLKCKYTDSQQPFMLALVEQMVNAWYVEDLTDEAPVRDMLQEYIKTNILDRVREKFSQGEIDMDDLKNAEQAFKRIQTVEPELRNPFRGNANTYLALAKRKPLGIDFLDNMTEGGLLNGEVAALIMPSGGGKTTIMAQGVSECVARKEHVLVFQFEQSLDGDIATRFYILATASSRKDWKENDINKVKPEIKKRYDQAAPLWSEYLNYCDTWVGGELPLRNVSDLFQVVEQQAAIGKKPAVVFIDWWGAMKLKLLAGNPNLRTDTERRAAEQEWLHEIKSLSDKYGVRTYVFQQLAGAHAARGSNHVASAHDAQENKNFPQYFDFVFNSSGKDTEDRVRMKLTKARSAKNSEVVLYLDGDHCKFVVAEDPNYDADLLSGSYAGGTPRPTTASSEFIES